MYLTRRIRDKVEAPLADLPFGLKIKARAWTDDTTINVVRGHERNVRLLAHEAAHAIRDEDNATMHHPWWHFCGLVGHALRLSDRHLTPLEIRTGYQLALFGDCDVEGLKKIVAKEA